MTAGTRELIEAEIARLADEYRSSGYAVVFEPNAEQLPKFLSDTKYRPDLIATKGSDRFVVEVTAATNRSERDRWPGLAAAIEANPGWHFRLVILDPNAGVAEYATTAVEPLKEWIGRCRKMLDRDELQATLLMSWSVFEAAARRRLLQSGAPLARPGPTTALVKQLVHVGLLAQEDLLTLQRLATSRNEIAHGMLATTVQRAQVEQLLLFAERLLDNQDSPE